MEMLGIRDELGFPIGSEKFDTLRDYALYHKYL